MRDLLFFLIIAGTLPFALRTPRLGVLIWVWISIANPHKESYGWLTSFPLLDLVAASTLLGAALNLKKLRFPKGNALAIFVITFYLWCTLTSIFAVFPYSATPKWVEFTKTMLLFFMIIVTHRTKRDVMALAWIIVISVSYTGIKSGLFTIVTLGGFKVWGPTGSAWGDNNGVSIVMLMTAPILIGLSASFKKKIYRLAALGTAVLFIISVFGTHSRGGLLGLIAVYLLYAWRSKRLFVNSLIGLFFAGISLLFMPAHWTDRMTTIESHDDQSAQTRLVQWEFAIDIANERPLFGNGFKAFFYPVYQSVYLADEIEENRYRAVHSIFFEVLGEQGYVGLIMFLMIGIGGLRYSNKLGHRYRHNREKDKYGRGNSIALMGYCIQFGLAGYAINGISVNMAYLDVYYIIVALLVCALEADKLEKKDLNINKNPNRRDFNRAPSRRL